MRILAIAILLITATVCSPALAIDDSGTLKGNVSESSLKRLPRPAAEKGTTSPLSGAAAAGRAALSSGIDTAAFDFDAHRKQIEAGMTDGMVPGWIQAPAMNGDQVRASLDRFFAPAHRGHDRFLPNPRGPRDQPAFISQLPPGFNVFVRVGLCGVWDANSDGRQRWQVLAGEMYMPGPLSGAWRTWQKQVSEVVESHSAELQAQPGAGSLHLSVMPDGTVQAMAPYNGGERPFRGVSPLRAAGDNLQSVLQRIGRLPPFPAGSRAQECHILVFVSNNN